MGCASWFTTENCKNWKQWVRGENQRGRIGEEGTQMGSLCSLTHVSCCSAPWIWEIEEVEIRISSQCVVAGQHLEIMPCYIRLPNLREIDIFAPFFFLLSLEKAVGILPAYIAKVFFQRKNKYRYKHIIFNAINVSVKVVHF